MGVGVDTVGSRDRNRIYWLSRSVILAVVLGSLGSLFWTPASPLEWFADLLLRTYLMFLGTVMAHEGIHGHLGHTKRANFGWGRLALLPTMVPFTNFRKTHHLHHAHTNIPDRDPDHFLRCRAWEFPLRALAMPHHWFFWLWRRGMIKRQDLTELLINYLFIFSVFGAVALVVAPERLIWGMLPGLVGVSFLLWYPFAYKTHEGFSTGALESRSHNYYGRLAYWFSLGLGLHRAHHMMPNLSWIELRRFVETCPGPLGSRLWPKRDIREGARAS